MHPALAPFVARGIGGRSARAVRFAGVTVLGLCLFGLLAVGPAAAQDGSTDGASNPVCQDDSRTLANMIEGFLQLTVALGVMGLLVVFQADTLMEMLAFDRDQKVRIKQHKRAALRSAVVLVILGPLFTVAASLMGLPIAECVDLIPF